MEGKETEPEAEAEGKAGESLLLHLLHSQMNLSLTDVYDEQTFGNSWNFYSTLP